MLSHHLPEELASLVRREFALGHFASEEDLLREALKSLAEQREACADIEEGLKELERGGGRPFEEFDLEMRRTFGIGDEP